MTAALFVFSLMTLTLGRPSVTRSEMVVRDEHPSIPKGYSAGGDAPLPGDTLRLTLAMPQTNVSGLHAALMDVSDPASESYGRHLSKAEVRTHGHRHRLPRIRDAGAADDQCVLPKLLTLVFISGPGACCAFAR